MTMTNRSLCSEECPHEEITCGSLEDRLSTPQKRKLLVNFLIKEIKAARLFAKDALSQPVSEGGDKELTPFLSSALNAASVPKPSGTIAPMDIISMLHKAADARLQKCVERPRPLYTAKLDMRQWKMVDKVVDEIANNCRSRSLLLLKRIDVTVNSFLWCDRIKSREAQIRELFAKRRAAMSHVIPPDVACLLAASHDLLRVEQASSARLRKNTRSKVHPLALAARPTDRGGRTNEMIGDIAREQASAQRGRGRGGGGFRGQPAPQHSHQQYGRDQQYGGSRDQQYGGQQQQYYGGPQQQYGGPQQQYGGPPQQYGMSREQMTQREYRGSGYQDGPRDRGRGGYGSSRGGRGGHGGYGGGGRGGYYGHDNRY
ncbi:hypothetical protein Y032_0357g3390 [Ancylostoma ceylanicum]|uniref:Protein FAM98A n=1 Tax=Ancylostoma ceylanicum TaxID=53326 RepID=A0A016RWX3_9BILA|nr:hypothetical protein Y032_0357g3390 [Ancylostoma ceylanicum]